MHREEKDSPDDADIELVNLTLDYNDLTDPELERRLVRRLDKRLLCFAMFGNMVKALDSTNLGSAFISGMEEELHVTGLQYNWMDVLFMIGYLSMQIPSNMLLSRLRPSMYLPFLEAIWCVLTVMMACVQTVRGVYIIRFLLGLAEAGFYPGIVLLIGTWYTKKELGKRLALLSIAGSLGAGLSGLVQAILLKTVDGIWGISGWRWMFLVDATITAILAGFGYWVLPDYPHNTQWLSKQEQDIASLRIERDGKKTKLSEGNRLSKAREMLSNKFLYPFVVGWATIHIAFGVCGVLGIVVKKLGYSAVTANLLTTPDMIITMIFGLLNGYISDWTHSRVWCILVPAVVALIGCMMLSAFVQPFGWLYTAFIFVHAGLGSTTSIIMTWASEVITSDLEIRAMAIATMNTSSSIMRLWTPLVLWRVTDAPRYQTGFACSVIAVLVFILSIALIAHWNTADLVPTKKDEDTTVIPLLQPEA